eukprot:m.189117 g.189117  ORF g.189117 m.189117 type:complete len:255 (-) comp32361_c2_seq6:293-1057(-)
MDSSARTLLEQMEHRLDANRKSDCVALFATHRTSINAVNKFGWSPLRLCVSLMDDSDAARHVEVLLRVGANQKDAKTKGGLAPVHEAARRGMTDTVKKLVLDDPDVVHLLTTAGLTALHYAAEGKSEAMVHFLLQNGAEPGCCTAEGNTAAHYAGAVGCAPILKQLLEGVNPCVVNHRGYTAWGKLWSKEVGAAVRRIKTILPTNDVAKIQATFPTINTEQAQDIFDEMAKQQPTNWGDRAHLYYAVTRCLPNG